MLKAPLTKEQSARRRYNRAWYLANCEEAKSKARARRLAHPTYERAWRERNPEYVNTWRQENCSRLRQYRKAWRQKNLLKVRVVEKKYRERRAVQQPQYAVKHRLRQRIRSAVREAGVSARKAASTFELLGCSLGDFRIYFEGKFQPGMSWQAVYAGDVHIDHKRPCASFDLLDPVEQRKCFHFSNLQPLWARDNMVKGAKYVG